MNQRQNRATTTDLEAFCPTCPEVEEVSTLLTSLGFRLMFSMPAQPERDTLPTLPAQYHYRHPSGTEAVFLAGRDSPLHTGALSLPPHASRFWLSSGGGDADAFRLARSRLALCWNLQWQKADQESDDGEEGNDVQEVA